MCNSKAKDKMCNSKAKDKNGSFQSQNENFINYNIEELVIVVEILVIVAYWITEFA